MKSLTRQTAACPGNIVLVGFMGAGKSVVGRRLAARLRRRFVDMDAVIAARAGKPISRIFAEDGEPVFRALERRLARELAAGHGLVVAAGGGVVLDPANLRDFGRGGCVVCLQASPDEILRRVGSSRERPLLNGPDPAAAIRELLARRRPFYAAVARQVETTGKTVAAVAAEVLALVPRSPPAR